MEEPEIGDSPSRDSRSAAPNSGYGRRFLLVISASVTLTLGYTAFDTWRRTRVAELELEGMLVLEAKATRRNHRLVQKSLNCESLLKKKTRGTLELNAALRSFAPAEFHEALRNALERAKLEQAFFQTVAIGSGQSIWICLPEEGNSLRIELSISADLQNYLDPTLVTNDFLHQTFELELEARKAYHLVLQAKSSSQDESTELDLTLDGESLFSETVLLQLVRQRQAGGGSGNELQVPRVTTDNFFDAAKEGKWKEFARYSCVFDSNELKWMKMETSVLSDAPVYGDGGAIALLEYDNIDSSIVKDDSVYHGMYMLKGLKPMPGGKSERANADSQMESQ